MSYWKTVCLCCALFAATAIASPAQVFTTLANFGGSNGSNPFAGLVQGFDGNFYGTTYYGGANNSGTVFKITPAGKLTTLYRFCAQSGCVDGANPSASLVQASNGDFYGTTLAGGANNDGTVFKITTMGTLTTLHSFDGGDGMNPSAGLIQATDGNFYGTTRGGGAIGGGTVFKITPSGTLTTLYSFCGENCTDGFTGTVFKITLSGTLTKLYSFCNHNNCSDGALPDAALIQATDGNFYGTTALGGANQGGAVFRITPTGTLTTLYSFCPQLPCADGYSPTDLVQATDGNFYGTTALGGANNFGTVFKTTAKGSLTTLYSFDVSDGATLVQATSGVFYGTTTYGGTYNAGTVFTLNVGLGPFVEAQPTSGKVGAGVKILGTSLTGATSVTFNGTAATFTVVSPSLITTTVPAGATTGEVKVIKPHGTVQSNVPFRVVH